MYPLIKSRQIEEPPTPYSYLLDDDEQESHPSAKVEAIDQNWEALNAKLHYESEKQRFEEEERQKRINIGEYEEDPQGEKKQKSFAAKRASHYNEFYVLKAMRNAQNDDDDDES